MMRRAVLLLLAALAASGAGGASTIWRGAVHLAPGGRIVVPASGSVGTIDAHDCPHGIVGEDGRACEVDSSIDLATAVPPAGPVRPGGGR